MAREFLMSGCFPIMVWCIGGIAISYLLIWAACKSHKISASWAFVCAIAPVIPMEMFYEGLKPKLFSMWGANVSWLERYVIANLSCYAWGAFITALLIIYILEYEEIKNEMSWCIQMLRRRI